MDAYFGKEFMDGELFSEEYDTEQAAAWMRSQSSGLEELMKTRKSCIRNLSESGYRFSGAARSQWRRWKGTVSVGFNGHQIYRLWTLKQWNGYG